MEKIHVDHEVQAVVFLVPAGELVPGFLASSQEIVQLEPLLSLHIPKWSAHSRLRCQRIEGSKLFLTFFCIIENNSTGLSKMINNNAVCYHFCPRPRPPPFLHFCHYSAVAGVT